MASKQASKSSKKSTKAKKSRTKSGAKSANGSAKSNGTATATSVEVVERMLRRTTGVTSYDTFGIAAESEEDYFVVPEPGKVYGRCGGREIHSPMEKRICDRLNEFGVAHCHRPRRYEVKINGDQIAAYSPCMALRGRGREGKTAIIEVVAERDDAHIEKVRAFRQLYEAEFYVIFAAPVQVLDFMPQDAHDEAVMPAELGSLVARLAE